MLHTHALVIYLLLSSTTASCPYYCHCNPWKMTTCTGKGIIDIKFLPKDTKRLTIRQTNITSFKLKTYNLLKLTDLALYSNKHLLEVNLSQKSSSLRNVIINDNTKLQSERIFIDTESILGLDLSDNNLKHVPKKLASSNRIGRLLIRGNQIESLELTDSTFSHLTYMSINRNPLKDIHVNLRHLKTMSLEKTS